MVSEVLNFGPKPIYGFFWLLIRLIYSQTQQNTANKIASSNLKEHGQPPEHLYPSLSSFDSAKLCPSSENFISSVPGKVSTQKQADPADLKQVKSQQYSYDLLDLLQEIPSRSSDLTATTRST